MPPIPARQEGYRRYTLLLGLRPCLATHNEGRFWPGALTIIKTTTLSSCV